MSLEDLFITPLPTLVGKLEELKKRKVPSTYTAKDIQFAKTSLENQIKSYILKIGERYMNDKLIQKLVEDYANTEDLNPYLMLSALSAAKEIYENDETKKDIQLKFAKKIYDPIYKKENPAEKFNYASLNEKQQNAMINYLQNSGFAGYAQQIKELKKSNIPHSENILKNKEKELAQTVSALYTVETEFILNEIKRGNKLIIGITQELTDSLAKDVYSTMSDETKIKLGAPIANKQYDDINDLLNSYKTQLQKGGQ